jgi:ATP-dependent DNA helicase RecG
MKRLDDAEIALLMGDLESDRVERKESFRGDVPVKVREAVCAFANDLGERGGPGVVFVGVRDDGKPVPGFAVTDELLLQLSDIKSDGNIVPPPTLIVEKRRVEGAELAAICVWPSDTPPVRYKGRIHVRCGPRRGLASAQDERILNERRRWGDRPYDVGPVRGATIEDLDLLRFEREYLPALVAPDVLAANDRSLEQKLAATKMVVSESEAIPTVLGMLVIGRAPERWIAGAYAQFLRVDGEDLTGAVIDEAVVQGTVGDQIRRLEEKIVAHNMRGVRFADVPLEERSETYPMEAFRQLVRNAFLHRSFEATNAPVKLYWFNDRVEIHSPGGPFGSVTRENFGRLGVTDYRNPNLAEAMRALGYVQRFGAGMAIARKALGERLRFEVEASHVLAVVKGTGLEGGSVP